ncbi:unnamed protein product [Oppiella nova]|uniref:Uncharacterized protein n=1 Tax=Oppiella nova TaxID=334625 RepID=A0A7R9QY09_9ACAR|nr:unnamed protein product [Oppiella nova]CAG2179120.1 unnamed protein product [Oppiella nova]
MSNNFNCNITSILMKRGSVSTNNARETRA